MRKLSRTLGLSARLTILAALLGSVFFPLDAAQAEKLVVTTDRARIIKLPDQTKTVIVGNPIIADVTIGKDGLVILTGKSFGTTNLIALDGIGAILNELTIQVQQANENVVIMQRGLDRETYSCTPTCMPTVALGDETKYFTDAGSASSARNKLATEK